MPSFQCWGWSLVPRQHSSFSATVQSKSYHWLDSECIRVAGGKQKQYYLEETVVFTSSIQQMITCSESTQNLRERRGRIELCSDTLGKHFYPNDWTLVFKSEQISDGLFTSPSWFHSLAQSLLEPFIFCKLYPSFVKINETFNVFPLSSLITPCLSFGIFSFQLFWSDFLWLLVLSSRALPPPLFLFRV